MPVSRPDDTWLKAAALGCLWAGAEILLRGFLHGLRVPMAGNIMTGIGIVLMIAVGHLWPLRGLFWRAGLVCALMTAPVSGAPLFGPGMAIVCQACLMELSLRIFRRNTMAFLLGSMLAMLGNIVPILLGHLLTAESGAIDLNGAWIRWNPKMFSLPSEQPWQPISLILAGQLTFGLGAGMLGIYLGRRTVGEPPVMSSLTTSQVMNIRFGRWVRPFPYSLGWLLANMVMLTVALVLVGFAKWFIWLPAGLTAIVFWTWRYGDVVRPLLRLEFWAWFVLITGFSGALLSIIESGWNGLLIGIGIGLAVNFRAAVLVVGFSALGMELRSPRIGWGLSPRRFRQVPVALEAAVGTLPWFMANLSNPVEVLHRPITVFHRGVAQTDLWLKHLTLRQVRRTGILLLCGHVGEGKSNALRSLVEGLRADGRRVAGILSPSVQRDGSPIGYDLVDVATGVRTELSRLVGEPDTVGHSSVGNFIFKPEGIRAGQAALSLSAAAAADVVVVDEVGPWELCHQGWAAWIYALTLETSIPMIWVVRSDMAEQVREHWALQDSVTIDLSDMTEETMLYWVREWLSLQRPGGAGHPISAAY